MWISKVIYIIISYACKLAENSVYRLFKNYKYQHQSGNDLLLKLLQLASYKIIVIIISILIMLSLIPLFIVIVIYEKDL